jgi:hypothetical protein
MKKIIYVYLLLINNIFSINFKELLNIFGDKSYVKKINSNDKKNFQLIEFIKSTDYYSKEEIFNILIDYFIYNINVIIDTKQKKIIDYKMHLNKINVQLINVLTFNNIVKNLNINQYINDSFYTFINLIHFYKNDYIKYLSIKILKNIKTYYLLTIYLFKFLSDIILNNNNTLSMLINLLEDPSNYSINSLNFILLKKKIDDFISFFNRVLYRGICFLEVYNTARKIFRRCIIPREKYLSGV